MDNKQAAAILEEIGLLLELQGESPFKSRAYYNGARTIEFLTEDLTKLVEEDKLKELPGIGKALTEKIAELVLTGRLAYYEELKKAIPSGVLELLRIPGLGPKKAGILYRELGITSIGELEYACKENRLITLKGFGAKTQAKFLAGVDYLKRFQGQHRLADAWPWAMEILSYLKDCPWVVEAEIAGSIRRGKEIVKDLDLVASSREPEKVSQYLTGLPLVEEVIALGPTKTSVKLEYGLPLDLRVVEPQQFPYALHHFTGSKEHHTALRHLAKGMKLKINEYGIFHGDELLLCQDEKDFYRVLGLDYIVPELRENTGEIEASLEGRLPDLVEGEDIKGVFHVHTNYSDGANTIEEMVKGARDRGYRYLGITDHSQSAFYAGGLKVEDLLRQREEIRAIQEEYPQIMIFHGIESEIKADGSLDYDDDILALFDFVIASVHSHFSAGADLTQRLIRAMSHPAVTMLGHPTGRLLLAREGYRVDMEAVLEAAREYQVIIELNASPARLDLDWRHLPKAKELGVKVSINPDAHRVEELDDIRYGVLMARKGWLKASDVFNTMGPRIVRRYLEERRRSWVNKS
ncbi:MAG: DNA polymerase/3'-5' exonuclease PolX [Firmicutes bacterium]|nr:DNA polymerase/3'-5' exonuclease PolX [Bacillota bacterium]